MFLKRILQKKSIQDTENPSENSSLQRVLGVKDLTFFGIAAIIGAGSFSSMGTACYNGGPGVILLFIICAIACGFTALCYAEFASRVPTSGSAYTYAYVSFGEIFAWLIGWALLMEYSIGNIYVAFSWSGYFTNLLHGFGIHTPEWLTTNYKSAHAAFENNFLGEAYNAWITAPQLAGLKIIFDLPALLINISITALVYVGIKESRNASNFMVYAKIAVVLLVIIVGMYYIDFDNWSPFMPNGFKGVMGGVSAVFFAFIGFDAVSTLSEECKNPQKDLPKGMIYSLLICTAIYIALSLVLTGMVSYHQLNVNDPLAAVFEMKGVKWMLFIVSIVAVIAMTSVMLVFQMGQPRIWMSMSRDGLLPKKFSSVHPKYKTPSFSTIATGIVVGVPILFTDENFVLDFTSIGTLFAFVLVCGGVLLLPKAKEKSTQKFNLPYINAQYILPLLVFCSAFFLWIYQKDFMVNLFTSKENIPLIIFFIVCVLFSILSYVKKYSLIPVLGLLSCCYLLTGMEISNWKWFIIWLSIGLVIYFIYGYRKGNKK